MKRHLCKKIAPNKSKLFRFMTTTKIFEEKKTCFTLKNKSLIDLGNELIGENRKKISDSVTQNEI